MTPDQTIQIWNAIGTWLSGFATTAAVVVALYLAKKSNRIDLKCHVGLRNLIRGDGSKPIPLVCFDITNRSERPVTINSVGWVVGKGKNRKFSIQMTDGIYPKELAYGQQVMFKINLEEAPQWIHEFVSGHIAGQINANLKTLRAQIHTSIGTIVNVVPESSFLEFLKNSSPSA